MDRTAFLKLLNNGTLHGVYVFEGEEEYLKEKALTELERKLLPEGLEALNESILDEPEIGKVYEDAMAMPFMCDKRLVVAKDPPFYKKKKRKKKESQENNSESTRNTAVAGDKSAEPDEEGDDNADDAETVSKLTALNTNNTSSIIILYLRRGFERAKLKDLKIEDKVVSFVPLTGYELVKMVQAECNLIGAAIDRDACNELIRYTGGNLTQIRLELNKLAAYRRNIKVIQKYDIQTLVTPDLETNVFKMIDALLAGDNVNAYTVLNEILDDGESRMMIMYMVTRQLKIMYYIKSMFDQRVPISAIQQRLELKNAYTVESIHKQTEFYTCSKLQELYQRSAGYEAFVKTGQISEKNALDSILTLIGSEVAKQKEQNKNQIRPIDRGEVRV